MPHHPDPLSLARELLEAAEKATAGEWRVEGRRGAGYVISHGICPEGDGPQGYVGVLMPMFPYVDMGEDDPAFIALTRTAAPALAQYALDASAEIERLRDSVSGLTADLMLAVETAYDRGATEWTRLNYPQWHDQIAAGAEARQARKTQARTALKDT